MNKHCIELTGRVASARRVSRLPQRLPLSMALAAMLGAGFLAPSGAVAETYTWTGRGGNSLWSEKMNWDYPSCGALCLGKVPPSNSSIIFDGGLPTTIRGVPAGIVLNSITFGTSASATSFETGGGGVISLTGGVHNFSSKKQTFNFRIDAHGDQTWAGGSAGVVVKNTGELNYSLTLADVTMVNGGNVNTTVGSTGTGILSLGPKSSLEAPEVMLGKEEGSKGTVNLTRAEARLGAVGNLIVGFAGEGILNVGPGQVTSNQAFVGMNYGSLGSVLIDGTTSKLTATSALEVGRASTGGVTVQNGGTLISGESFIGRSLGGDGLVLVTGAGSSWTATGPLTVGDVGVGSVRVEAGGTLNSVGATLGSQAGSLGQVKVMGANASWVATGHDVQVGHLGDGLLSIEQGGLVSNRNTLVGVIGDPGTSKLTVTGVNSRLQSSETLTVQSGSVEITNGGQATVPQAHFAEHGIGATAQVDLSGTGAMLTTTSWLGIGGDTSQATLNLGAGATLNSTGEMYVGKGGVLNLNGGTLNANYNAYFYVGGQVNWNTGTVNINSSASTGDRLLDHSVGLGAGMNMNVANRLTIQAGDNLSFTGGQGSALELLNDGDLGVGSLSTLRVGTGGVLNRSALLLAGGTISSIGRLDKRRLGEWLRHHRRHGRFRQQRPAAPGRRQPGAEQQRRHPQHRHLGDAGRAQPDLELQPGEPGGVPARRWQPAGQRQRRQQRAGRDQRQRAHCHGLLQPGRTGGGCGPDADRPELHQPRPDPAGRQQRHAVGRADRQPRPDPGLWQASATTSPTSTPSASSRPRAALSCSAGQHRQPQRAACFAANSGAKLLISAGPGQQCRARSSSPAARWTTTAACCSAMRSAASSAATAPCARGLLTNKGQIFS